MQSFADFSKHHQLPVLPSSIIIQKPLNSIFDHRNIQQFTDADLRDSSNGITEAMHDFGNGAIKTMREPNSKPTENVHDTSSSKRAFSNATNDADNLFFDQLEHIAIIKPTHAIISNPFDTIINGGASETIINSSSKTAQPTAIAVKESESLHWRPEWQNELIIQSNILISMQEEHFGNRIDFIDFFTRIQQAINDYELCRYNNLANTNKKTIPASAALEKSTKDYLANTRIPDPIHASVTTLLKPFQKVISVLQAPDGDYNPDVLIPSAPPHISSKDYLSLAMFHHQRNELEISFHHLAQSASLNNPISLYLLGVALKYGSGCPLNEHLAVRTLVKSAKATFLHANDQCLQQDYFAALLPLAIFELGICFRLGIGLLKSKVMSAFCFCVAGILGDADAQVEFAECYMQGHGVIKDKLKAAKWYREAELRGKTVLGMSWIHKKKNGGSQVS